MEINLPDGSTRKLENGSNGLDLAKSIGSRLAKSAVAVTVDGEQRDLLDTLPENSSVSIITISGDSDKRHALETSDKYVHRQIDGITLGGY